MAYPSICENCRNNDCENCLEAWNLPPKGMVGGAFCVCGHGEPESDFQLRIRKRQDEIHSGKLINFGKENG